LRYALDVAIEHDKPSAALRGYYNLSDTLSHLDRYEDADACVREGLAYAHRVGNRRYEMQFLGQCYPLFALGKWDELLQWTAQVADDWLPLRRTANTVAGLGVIVLTLRAQLDEAERLSSMVREFATSGDTQERVSHRCGTAWLCLAKSDPGGALEEAEVVLEARSEVGVTMESVKEAFVVALEAALALDDVRKAEELLQLIDGLPPGHSPQYLQAQSLRFHARIAGNAGRPEAERLFKRATGLFRELAMPFYLATSSLEYAEWLISHGRNDDAKTFASEAHEVFEMLGARRWLDRAANASGAAKVPA
jgi:hypothetical protein